MKKVITLLIVFTVSLSAQNYTMQITEKVNGEHGEMKGVPGDVLTADLVFTNSTPNLLRLSINRYLNDIPSYWALCYCYTQCYSPADDTVTVALAPMTSSMVTLYYKTDSVNPGIAHASFEINEIGTTVTETLNITASTLDYTGIGANALSPEKMFLSPNPASSQVNFQLSADGPIVLQVLDATGTTIRQSTIDVDNEYNIDISELAGGIYFIRAKAGTKNFNAAFIKQ